MKRLSLSCIVLGVFLRIALAIFAWHRPALFISPDSEGYIRLAVNLRNHGTLSFDAEPPYRPDVFRPPAYPLMLAMLGKDDSSLVRHAILLQTILAVALLIYLSCWINSLWGTRAAYAATVWFALDPSSILVTPKILSETLFLIFLSLALKISWKSLQSNRPFDLALAAFLWASCAFIKPFVLLLPLALCFSWPHWKQRAVILVIAYGFLGTWIVRNRMVAGFTGFTSQSGGEQMCLPTAGIESLMQRRPFGPVLKELCDEIERPYPHGFQDQIEKNKVYGARCFPTMKAHPFYLAAFSGIRILDMYFSLVIESYVWLLDQWRMVLSFDTHPDLIAALSKTTQWLGSHRVMRAVKLIYAGVCLLLYLVSVRGLMRLWDSSDRALAKLLGSAILYLTLVSSPFYGNTRYKIPLMPFFITAFAAAFADPERLRKKPAAA